MSKSKGEWFVSRGGQRFGPVSFSQLQEAAKAGRLEPRTDLLFGGDLSEWKPAGQVEGVFSSKDKSDRAKAKKRKNSKEDLSGMAATADMSRVNAPQSIDMPGAKRLGYFLGTTLLPLVLFLGLAAAMPKIMPLVDPKYGHYLPLIAVIVPLVFYIAITAKRFQNLGMSGGWVFGLLVPLLNLWLWYRLFACPPGYALSRRMDGPGWVLAVIYWLLQISYIGSLVVTGTQIQKYATDPASIQQMIDWLEDKTDSEDVEPLIEQLEQLKEELKDKAKQ